MHIQKLVAEIRTTVGSQAEAQRIAKELLFEKLAVCVQIDGPIESSYHWEGKIETAEEWRLAIKTTTDRSESLQRVLIEMHPYDLPEVLVYLVSSSPEYSQWISKVAESDK